MTCDILVVGAGPAGLTAAIYGARAGRSVLVLEQSGVGGQIAYAPRVENYPGIAGISGEALSDALLSQAEGLGVSLELEAVERIVPGLPHTVVTDCGTHRAGAVIVAAGAEHRRLGVPGEELAGVSFCAVCDGAFFRGKDVAVVGGGSTALESAELLAGICRSVLLIHRRRAFRGEPALAERVLGLANVTAALDSTVREILGADGAVAAVVLDTPDGPRTVPVEGVFLCVGQTPQNGPFAGVLDLDADGWAASGEDCRTRTPGIFAAGDCRAKAVRQLTTAVADGAVAALAACGYLNAAGPATPQI